MANRLELIEPGVVPFSECPIVSSMPFRHQPIKRYRGEAVYLWIDLENYLFQIKECEVIKVKHLPPNLFLSAQVSRRRSGLIVAAFIFAGMAVYRTPMGMERAPVTVSGGSLLPQHCYVT